MSQLLLAGIVETGSLEEAGKLVTSSDLPDVDLRMLIEEKVG